MDVTLNVPPLGADSGRQAEFTDLRPRPRFIQCCYSCFIHGLIGECLSFVQPEADPEFPMRYTSVY